MDLFVLFLCFSGIFVDVFGLGPTFDVPAINVTVQEGGVAVLPCPVDNLGYHKVEWKDQSSTLLTADDQRFVDDPRISIERPRIQDWNLQIRNTTYSDRGQYTCQINTNPVKNKTVMLIVLIPSKIVSELSSRDQTVREGETVTLVCNVTGVPTPDVTWYKLANEGTQAKESIGTTGEVLTIHNISRYYDGTYECVVSNNVGPAVTRQIKVFVEFAPEVSLPTKRIDQYPGRETILDCEITAYPHAVMYWKQDEREADFFNKDKYQVELYSGNKDSKSKTLSLRIRNLQQDDFGQYTCYAENMIGSDKESMYLYDYSTQTKHKSTTMGPTLIESTPNILSNIPFSGGDRTGNSTQVWMERPDSSNGSGDNNGSYNTSQGYTTLHSTSKAAAHDHAILTSVSYVLSLLTSLLVLFSR